MKLHITAQSGPVICVCVCVLIKLHITAQSGPVILVIRVDPPKGGSMILVCVCVFMCVCVCIY